MVAKSSEDYSLEELKTFLDKLEIEPQQSGPKTFLEIINREHYEIYWSRIYAFFFDPEEDHDFGDLFLRSLQELIWEDSKPEWEFDISTTTVRTEEPTTKGNRIDLLIKDEKHCIIIENKVFHHSGGNDFEDYWNSVKMKEANKKAVLLTLNKEEAPENFKNITHQELIAQVKKNLESIEEIKSKYRFFLEDLEMNIKNISSITLDKDQITFFLDHQEKLLKAKSFYENARKYLLKEAEIAITKCEKLELKGGIQKEGVRIGKWKSEKINFLEFLVDFREFDKTQKMQLLIKINKPKYIGDDFDYRSWLEEKGADSKAPGFWKYIPSDVQKEHCHLAVKEYDLNASCLQNLFGLIIKEFEEFKPLFEEIEKLLKAEKV